MAPRRVLLYGGSLLLSVLGESLSQCPGLHVARAATWVKAKHALAEHIPDVLIFDMTESRESQILALFFKNPNLLLIGLDPEYDQAVVLSGQKAHALTLSQLERIVQQEGPLSTLDLAAS